jgi:hypothetical protein
VIASIFTITLYVLDSTVFDTLSDLEKREAGAVIRLVSDFDESDCLKF